MKKENNLGAMLSEGMPDMSGLQDMLSGAGNNITDLLGGIGDQASEGASAIGGGLEDLGQNIPPELIEKIQQLQQGASDQISQASPLATGAAGGLTGLLGGAGLSHLMRSKPEPEQGLGSKLVDLIKKPGNKLVELIQNLKGNK